ncbi:MAG: sucrose phosphorylase [Lachnospiraceae bacterium]|nr:sucrose phosphorylase [Lachnospiraceae bacterium]
MRQIENKCMLITYADSMGGDLKALEHVLDTYFKEEIAGVHILPFFPSSGDRGFAVINYDEVDPSFGTWEDIDRLAEKYTLAADFMLNHISIRAEEFQDYMEKGDASAYRDMFIHWDEFWPEGRPNEEDLRVMYSRKPGGPCREFTLNDGSKVKLWCTFYKEQVDIDPYSKATQEYYRRNLGRLASHVPMIRFDAFAYTSKVPGTSCFFIEPQIWDILDISMEPLRETGASMLAEIHEEYHIQIKLADRGHYVYDFALPLLLLHAIEFKRTDRLLNWLKICPHHQITTLDTHDGIGVVDAAGLMTEDEMDEISQLILGRYRKAFSEQPKELQKLDPLTQQIISVDGKQKIYQLPGTFFSDMNEDEDAYLLARAVQLFTPGIPQIYYVGLLAWPNDFAALQRGDDGREVNRHNFTEEEIAERIKAPFLQRMYALMRLRNTSKAFDGSFSVREGKKPLELVMRWENGNAFAELAADFDTKTFAVRVSAESDAIAKQI